MTLTRFSDYSLRILMFAALQNDRRFSVDEVAAAYRLSRHHTAKAVNFLTRNGYLRAQRGPGGGICLGRLPEEISLGELVRRTEKGAPLVECFDAATNTCPIIQACVLKQALAKAWAAFFHTLDEYTLADLVGKPDPLRRVFDLNLAG
ncbi:MAG TPA: Rrf2 family transcriptional regulator [Verrucomicrobiae bacterium]|nr:Rrf2 family transcriptional regulator [Verrucomicrobiae bacterium]